MCVIKLICRFCCFVDNHDQTDADGNTELHRAAKMGDLDAVLRLCHFEQNVLGQRGIEGLSDFAIKKNNQGKTAMDVANDTIWAPGMKPEKLGAFNGILTALCVAGGSEACVRRRAADGEVAATLRAVEAERSRPNDFRIAIGT
eukprot:Selendium_serpulae@DN3492_c0_g1_i3.p1